MNEKKIKEAMKQYIEMQTDNILSEPKDEHDFSSLDEKVYADIHANQEKRKGAAVLSFRKISVIAASLFLIIGLSISAAFITNKRNEYTMFDKETGIAAQNVCYSIIILYENEQYGYYSNSAVIDKYGIKNISDIAKNQDLFTGTLTADNIIQLDSVIDKNSIIGAKIYPYSNSVIILKSGEQYYYFEKIISE